MRNYFTYLVVFLCISCGNEEKKPEKPLTEINQEIIVEEEFDYYAEEERILDSIHNSFDLLIGDFISSNSLINMEQLDSIYFDIQNCFGLCNVDTMIEIPYMTTGNSAASFLDIKGELIIESTETKPDVILTLYSKNKSINLDLYMGSWSFFRINGSYFRTTCEYLFQYFLKKPWTRIDWEKGPKCE